MSKSAGARNLGLVLASFVLRLAAGMLVMVFMARALGRSEFGNFAYWLAVATLLTVLVNLGLGTYVLREIGIDRQRYGPVMGAALTTKLLVTGAVLLLAAAAWPWLPAGDAAIFSLLVLAQLFDSFGEFFNLGFRRDGQFRAEALTAVFTSLLHLALMALAIFNAPQALHCALAFAASRALGMLLIAWRSMATTGLVRPAGWRAVPPLLRSSWAYSGELFLNTAYGQVDSLLVNLVLGVSGVGLYQAGMKLVDGASRLAPVMAQFVLPTLTARQHDPARFRRTAWLVVGLMAGLGALGGLVLALGANLIVTHLYGAQYEGLRVLLPWFGAVLALRYAETAIGLVLVARGLQARKVWLVAAQLLLVTALGYPALHSAGLSGWLEAVAAAWLAVILMYLVLWQRSTSPAPQRNAS